jgi:hypothetical protein
MPLALLLSLNLEQLAPHGHGDRFKFCVVALHRLEYTGTSHYVQNPFFCAMRNRRCAGEHGQRGDI